MLVPDHKPHTSILGLRKGVSAVAAARLQRLALLCIYLWTGISCNRPSE